MGEGEGEKYCLLCNKVASEVLPQAQSAMVDSKSKEQTFEGSDSNLVFSALN